MKHFANCTPDEFMAQVVKFREPFMKWIKDVGAAEIRARRPEGFDKLEGEERDKAVLRQANANLGEILFAALEKDPDGTREVLCLSTFTEPEDFNTHTMVEYIQAVFDMLGSKEVRNFFTFYLAPMMKTFSGD